MTIPITHYLNRDKDTICAVTTPPGFGGVSVIRISGPRALNFIKVLSPTLKTDNLESHRSYFRKIVNHKNEILDEVLITYFQQGKSFTGESTVEISCHGNPLICKNILDALITAGARHAEKGEFTYRAFINGRIDLTQAEAVLDLIQASNSNAAKKALQVLDGDLSQSISTIEDELTWCLAHIEAGIDFSTEGLEVVEDTVLIEKLLQLSKLVSQLNQNFKSSQQIKQGLRVVLIGEPNVGKSSLLNLMLMKDRAIVSPIAGTTRDVVDGDIFYNNLKVCFVDTAGIRDAEIESVNEIEKLGIERSKNEFKNADLALYVFDALSFYGGLSSTQNTDLVSSLSAQNTAAIFLLNKSDLLNDQQKREVEDYFYKFASSNNNKFIFTSAIHSELRNSSREEILKLIYQSSELSKSIESDFVSINQRQHENLNKVEENIHRAVLVLQSQVGAEFVALELKEALMALHDLLGKRFDDQIMDRVFKEFCIGK